MESRLDAGEDRAGSCARAPADVADPVGIDVVTLAQEVDRPAHGDDVADLESAVGLEPRHDPWRPRARRRSRRER